MIKKALLYRDWKYSKWFILPLTLIFLYNSTSSLFGLHDETPRNYRQLGDFLGPEMLYIFLVFFTLTFMSFVLFYPDRKPLNYTFSASLPFKRKDIILSKWLTGFFNILSAHFIIYILANVGLILTYSWKTDFINLTRVLLIDFLTIIFMFGFLMMIQSLKTSPTLGVATATVIAAFPLSLMYWFSCITTHYYTQYFFIPDLLKSFFNSSFFNILLGGVWKLFGFNIRFHTSSLFNVSTDYYHFGEVNANFFLRVFALILLTIAFYHFSKKAYEKNNFEENDQVTTFKNLSPLFKILGLYYISFIIHQILSSVSSEYTLRLFAPDIVLLFCVIIPLLAYFILIKTSKFYNNAKMSKDVTNTEL
ncbi:hypothetical protein RBH29_15195 [Herbivorax sp. ANBcel31]|uniref:hypothetical protein n=1 Tax=Herbivorax sp. ANBcel31 TaxID=3069754 RepID=UPI0027B7610C|nr:hypothetical protein [Herbivorax sp. ANBcel31]MDQ2087775.1 hypothetical protein [Herbivorax sp. ANBcel31]